jgi:uncharacterized pyridoxamine 5'-phosphate oxidase family protein
MSLEDPHVHEFLGQSMVVRVATLSSKGQPHITPLWFVWDQGRIYVNLRSNSPAARNISANPEVVLLLDSEGRLPDHVLRIRGRASVRREGHIKRRTILRSALKYHLSLGGLRNLFRHLRTLPIRLRYYAERGGEAAVIEVLPEDAEFLPGYP